MRRRRDFRHGGRRLRRGLARGAADGGVGHDGQRRPSDGGHFLLVGGGGVAARLSTARWLPGRTHRQRRPSRRADADAASPSNRQPPGVVSSQLSSGTSYTIVLTYTYWRPCPVSMALAVQYCESETGFSAAVLASEVSIHTASRVHRRYPSWLYTMLTLTTRLKLCQTARRWVSSRTSDVNKTRFLRPRPRPRPPEVNIGTSQI